jgi:hypothetical protein
MTELAETSNQRGFGLAEYTIGLGVRNDTFYLDIIKELGGYISSKDAKKLGVGQTTILRLRRDNLMHSIELSMKCGRGAIARRCKHEHLFKPEFEEKTFYYDSRTALVRLLGDAFLPLSEGDRRSQGRVSHWLKNHVSEAERLAVLWRLGVRKFHHSGHKRNMQIDGVV